MKNPLENFKFATIKNVSIKVQELDDKIEIRIEPIDTETAKATEKKIEIYYKPVNYYGRGDFQIEDNHKEIVINRSFMISVLDDVDWDFEQVYPCSHCEAMRELDMKNQKVISELRKKAEKLLDLFLNY